MMTETEALFEYPCPECGFGVVQTTKMRNYKAKIKGYPFVVDEALIGICNHCQARHFAPEETKRWEQLFSHTLEARQAFLSPEEITELRTALGVSMEDFARLIGSTRQSISTWEKAGRVSPPSRTADLLMKLVKQSLHTRTVDVLSFLLEEAKKWGVVIQLRDSTMPSAKHAVIVLRPKSGRRQVSPQHMKELTLAMEVECEKEEPCLVETTDGRLRGVLGYDCEQAALTLDITGPLPSWETVDVEIETHDGQRFTTHALSLHERLVLLEGTSLREQNIAQITLKEKHQ